MHHICLVRRFGELTTAAGNITRLGSVNLWRPDMYDPLPNGGLIRKLWISETDIYRDHLLRLDGESRRRRFSGAVADEFIVSHAATITGADVVVHGFFVDGVLRGAAELRGGGSVF